MLDVNFDVLGIKSSSYLAIHVLVLATITCATPITDTCASAYVPDYPKVALNLCLIPSSSYVSVTPTRVSWCLDIVYLADDMY